jgi:hypothetical protein
MLSACAVVALGSRTASAQAERAETAPSVSELEHTGFYFRVATGLHYTSIFGEHTGGDASLNGLGTSVGLLFGGTASPGLVVGGTLGFIGVSGTFTGAPTGASDDAHAAVPLFGAFVDYYTKPDGPWHVGGAFGIGGYSGRDSLHTRYIGHAPAAQLFGGYDRWFNPCWAMGIGLVTQAASSARAKDLAGTLGYKFAVLSIGFQLSFVYF